MRFLVKKKMPSNHNECLFLSYYFSFHSKNSKSEDTKKYKEKVQDDDGIQEDYLVILVVYIKSCQKRMSTQTLKYEINGWSSYSVAYHPRYFRLFSLFNSAKDIFNMKVVDIQQWISSDFEMIKLALAQLFLCFII